MELTKLLALFATGQGLTTSLLTIGVIVLASIIFAIVAWIKKEPLTIKLGFATFTFGKKKEVIHEKCNEIAMHRFRNMIVQKEKMISKYNSEIFERQMNFCDDKINVVRDMFMDEYRTLLSRKLERTIDVKNHDSYRHYMMMVDLMLNYCINEQTFKKSMKQNHLLELTIVNWEEFIEDKIRLTFSLMKRFYDDYYPESSLVSRNEVDESNDRLFEKIRPIITTMYRKAREITTEVTNKVSEIQKEIDSECKNGTFEILCVEQES